MLDFAQAARRWIEPLLALRSGGPVALRFLAATADPAAELGLPPAAPDSFADYAAPASYVRELSEDELSLLAGRLRQGAREVLLSDAFVASVAAAQGLLSQKEVFEAAAGVLIGGQICRIVRIKPLAAGSQVYAWQLLCDAPLDVT